MNTSNSPWWRWIALGRSEIRTSLTRGEREQLAAIESRLAAEEPGLNRALAEFTAHPGRRDTATWFLVAGLMMVAMGAVVVAATSGAGTLAAMAIPIAGMLMAVIGLGAAARHPRR